VLNCGVKNAINSPIFSLFGKQMKVFFAISILVVIATTSACVKAPSYPIIPEIEYVNISSPLVKSGYADTITISFKDGDGDIGITGTATDTCDLCGFKTGDSSCLYSQAFNIFLIDDRDTCVSQFASADIEPSGKFDAISGQADIIKTIYSQNCFIPTPGCPNDTVRYTVVMRDKAGHFSNFIKLPPIIINGEP
jgi:hypothetical protein